MTTQTRELIQRFKLTEHPEGGFYAQTYRSPHSTAIHFLLTQKDISKFHRIKSDELWHFYLGGSLTIVEITPAGKTLTTVLGQKYSKGESLQYAVKAGHWFGAYCNEGTEFSLVGCTVAPGFDFKDFEMAKREDIAAFLSSEHDTKFFPAR